MNYTPYDIALEGLYLLARQWSNAESGPMPFRRCVEAALPGVKEDERLQWVLDLAGFVQAVIIEDSTDAAEMNAIFDEFASKVENEGEDGLFLVLYVPLVFSVNAGLGYYPGGISLPAFHGDAAEKTTALRRLKRFGEPPRTMHQLVEYHMSPASIMLSWHSEFNAGADDPYNLNPGALGWAMLETMKGMTEEWAQSWPGTVFEHLKPGTEMVVLDPLLDDLAWKLNQGKLNRLDGANQLIALLDNAPMAEVKNERLSG